GEKAVFGYDCFLHFNILFLQGLFETFPFRDVVNEGGKNVTAVPANRRYRQFNRKFCLIPRERSEFDAFVQNWSLASFEKSSESLFVRLPILRRDDRIHDASPNNFFRFPAEKLFRTLIPFRDPAARINCHAPA